MELINTVSSSHKTKGFVDIILPIYKPSKKVYESIQSIFDQTYQKWHLYIIDDASDDGSIDRIAEKYKKQNNKITYFKLLKNRRAVGARAYAIAQGYGEFLAFMDQDDYWLPEKLELQAAFLGGNLIYGAVHTDVKLVDEGDRFLEKLSVQENLKRQSIEWEGLSNHKLAKELFIANSIRFVSSMVRREAFLNVGGFNCEFFGGEDEEFWVRFAYHYKIYHLPKVLLVRREHTKNTSKVYIIDRTLGELQAVKKMCKQYKFLRNLAGLKYRLLYERGIRKAYYEKGFRATFKFTQKSLTVLQFSPRFIVVLILTPLRILGRRILNRRNIKISKWY